MSKTTLAKAAVRQFAISQWGALAGFRPLQEGLASQAFAFTQAGQQRVLRVNRRLEGFQKDAFVSQRLTGPDLPVPEVLAVGQIDAVHAYCLSRLAAGVRLTDLMPSQVDRLVEQLLTLLITVANTDLAGTTGYGWFDSAGQGPYRRWADFLRGLRDPSRYDWAALVDKLPLAAIEPLLAQIEWLAPACPEIRHLIHGDLGGYNILTDGEQITALIDWDRAMYGDPLYDVAGLLFWEEQGLMPLLTRLREEVNTRPGGRERIRCYQLRQGLQEIYEVAAGLNPMDVDWLLARCQTLAASS